MKKEYTAPEMEITAFSTEDVVTLSVVTSDPTSYEYGELFG
jgi:hypothetical protein